jgi:EmrB/QacA subfamily drug resistance transporter
MLGLHVTIITGLWTLTSYVITSTVFLLPAGRWADMIGSKRVFLLGFAVFTAATVLCGAAPSGSALLVFRFIQGTGAALALATATPIIVRTFPAQELGRALGINSTSWVIGSIVGPVAGGILVSALGWRSIFYVTVPFALLGMVTAWFVLPDSPFPPRQRAKTDWAGLAAFGFGLVALLVALSEGQPWGWTSWRTVSLLIAAVALFAGFIAVERTAGQPLFDLSLFRHRHYSTGLGVTLSYSVGYFATTFLLTLYLQGALHRSPLQTGLLLVPLSAPQLVLAPVGGTIADRIGAGPPILAGVILLCIGGYLLGNLGPHLSVPSVVWPLLLMSAATGLAWPALTKTVMSSVPRQQTGIASGMFYTFRNVGMSMSLTLALVVAEMSVPPAVAAKAFLGMGNILNPGLEGTLVRSTDAGFRFFVAFYIVALLLSLALLRPARQKDAAEPAR